MFQFKVLRKVGFTIINTPRQYDLLDLYRTQKHQLFSDINLDAGTYNQLRIDIGKVTITPKSGLNGVEAKLPSGSLRLNTKVVVEKGKISAITFDFISTKALHKTVDGAYMFFPVLKVSTEHQDSSVQTLGGNTQVIGGLTDFDQTWGVDENGNLKKDYIFNGLSKIELLGKVIHVIPIDEKTTDITISAQAALNTATTNKYIDSPISIQTVMRQGKRVWQIIGIKSGSAVKIFVDINSGAVIAVE